MRCFLASLVSGVLFFGANAQEQYRAELSVPLTTPAEKVLRADLWGLDQEFTLQVNGALLDLSLRWDLTAAELDAFLFPFSTSVIAFDHVTGAEVPSTPKATAGTAIAWPVDFPVRLDTGDPIADDARYELYKSTWIAAYPELYNLMTQTSPRTPPPDPE